MYRKICPQRAFYKHFKPLAGASISRPALAQTLQIADLNYVADDFRTTQVGERYAQALFDLAEETAALDAVRGDLASLKAAWLESADLRRLATSPVISAEDQGKGLGAIADKAKFNATTKKFLGLLAQNGRSSDLPGVIAAFETLYVRKNNLVTAEVVSALPLTAAQSKNVQAALRTALGRDPELTTRVDPSILGGLKVKVGSKLFDASLKTKLDQMTFALKRA
jgi:F-type H+-transporting ATPase subunit delta